MDGRTTTQIMRDLVQSGHTVVLPGDIDDERCTLVGKRHGSGEEIRVTYSLLEAKDAGLLSNYAWAHYPREMLVSRTLRMLAEKLDPKQGE